MPHAARNQTATRVQHFIHYLQKFRRFLSHSDDFSPQSSCTVRWEELLMVIHFRSTAFLLERSTSPKTCVHTNCTREFSVHFWTTKLKSPMALLRPGSPRSCSELLTGLQQTTVTSDRMHTCCHAHHKLHHLPTNFQLLGILHMIKQHLPFDKVTLSSLPQTFPQRYTTKTSTTYA